MRCPSRLKALTPPHAVPAASPLTCMTSRFARQPHSPPQSTLVSVLSFLSLLQCVAKQVFPVRPTFLPLPATQLDPLSHCSSFVQTPTALGHGQSTVQVRSVAVLHTGLSTQTTSVVAVPATLCF